MFDKDYRKVIWQDIELINKFAEKNGYNRQVDIDRLKVDLKKAIESMGYEDFESIVFVASALLLHQHKGGEECEPHMRISIFLPDLGAAIIDCDLDIWRSLESIDKDLVPSIH